MIKIHFRWVYMDSYELLIDVLQNKNPILFLGAGYSLGALNKDNKRLLDSKALAKELYSYLITKKFSNDEIDRLFYNEDKKCDLKYICNILELKNLTQERNAFLTKRFYGSHCAKRDYHFLLKKYPWKTIYSLNIDDLIENIYENKLTVQLLGGESENSYGTTTLIKLHGSVLRPELGYVFSEKEYQRYLSQDSWAINSFAVDYFRSDIIFLGTEFQENDLQSILDRFSDAGAVNKAHNYFFITPTLNDPIMEMKIASNHNFHHIPLTTEEFLKFIVDEISIKKSQRQVIKNQGAIFFDEEKRSYNPTYLNSGNLYQGNIPNLSDFFGDWDIRYPNSERWVKELISNTNHKIVALYGEPYSGKTCVAMRMALDLYNNGFFAFSFSLNLGIDAVQYSRLILEFLGTLPQDSKCVILAENMAYYYSNLKYIIDNCPKSIKQLVFLVTANREEHQAKKYIFDRFINFEQHHISYEINNSYAQNIYDKLVEKSHLNNLLKYSDNARGIIKVIRNLNDIIEVLYVSQEGRKFSEHFAMWLDQKGQEYVYKKTFEVLCFLGELDIEEVPLQFLLRMIANMGIRMQFDNFKSIYGDYLICNSEYIKIRCLRIIKEQVLKNMTENDKCQIILYAANYCAPFIKERETTIYSRIFQMLIKVKKLSHGKILSDNKILEVLEKLGNKAMHLSYYWIQVGIANRNLERFEEANNAFHKAADVRGIASYNVEHAQAKNYMAWGLWEIENHKSDSNNFFGRGKDMLRSLITDSPRQYFVYSVHSYTDMMLKYYKRTKSTPTQEEINYIIENLNEISNLEDDKYSSQILTDFRTFCLKHKINCSSLIYHIHRNENEFIDIDDIGNF